jgi:hypothetical protein
MLYLQVKPREEHLNGAPLRQAPTLLADIRLARLTNQKHSSLLNPFVRQKGKSVVNTEAVLLVVCDPLMNEQ